MVNKTSCLFGTYRVPNLKFDLVVVDGDRSRAKLDTNGQVMYRLESLISELKQKAGLSHGCKFTERSEVVKK